MAELVHGKRFGREKIVAGKAVLHFAPEVFLRPFFQQYAGKYVTADFLAAGYSHKDIDLEMDISDMQQVADNSYDLCIAIDVLEHVPDDVKAIGEIYRILSKGGYAILSVPQKDNLKKTIGDPRVTDPEERLLKYGQRDHLRIYGSDFCDMLTRGGFKVEIVDEHSFPLRMAEKHVLFPPILSNRELVTNFRKIYFALK
jgi:SAM-dependent methyltransferase